MTDARLFTSDKFVKDYLVPCQRCSGRFRSGCVATIGLLSS